jgi:5'(3')-deoxyribonucleotidase
MVSERNRKIIGIDLDGVIIDHTRNFILFSRRYGIRLKSWQTNSNIFQNFVDQNYADQIKHLVYAKHRGSAPMTAGALDFIKLFRDKIVFASVQKEREGERRLWQWLDEKGILKLIPKSRIRIFRKRSAKIRYVNKLQPDIFIDDGLDVLEYLTPKTRPIMFDSVGAQKHVRVKKWISIFGSWNNLNKYCRDVIKTDIPSRRSLKGV